jgi:hypothetical protein
MVGKNAEKDYSGHRQEDCKRLGRDWAYRCILGLIIILLFTFIPRWL